MMSDPDQIKGWTAIGIAVAGVLLSMGTWLQKVRSHGKAIQELRSAVAVIPEDIKRRLYDDKSQPIYVPMVTFEKIQAACSRDLKNEIGKIDKKLDRLIEFHMGEKQ